MQNRILAAVDRAKKLIDTQLAAGKITQANLDALSKKLDASFEDWIVFQNKKSEAHAGGKLSHEEAVSIFAFLGGSPEAFNAQPLEVKMTCTQALAEIMEMSNSAYGAPACGF